MKTFTPFTSVSWLALTLSACGGEDPAVPAPTDPNQETTPSDTSEPTPTIDTSKTPKQPRQPLDGVSGRDMPLEPGMFKDADRVVAQGFRLAWRDCGLAGTRQVQCAELQVPLDYAEPDGEQILIALNRVLPPPGVESRGSVLINPGGPGSSGKEVARQIASAGAYDYAAPGLDLVGFDPRGIGDSSGLECEFVEDYFSGEAGDAAPEDAMMQAISRYGLEGVIDDLTWLSGECRNYWGGLFDHMGSNQVVKDIDRIREALGEEKLNFIGISYGTRLGALYAQEYPDRTRAIVLDAPVHPETSIVNQVQGQFDSLLVMHETFFSECASGAVTCPPDPRAVFDAMLVSADALGLRGLMLSAWELGLAYGFAGPGYLAFMLESQATQPNSDWMYGALAFAGLPSNDVSGYIQNMNVNCADNAAPFLTLEEADLRLDDALLRSPVFGDQLSPIVHCNGWDVAPDPVAPLTAPDAPPILVIGGTRDHRTAPEWAPEMADSLASGVLLSSEHWGHGVVGGSRCVDAAVRAYLLDLTLPAEGTVCPDPALPVE
jgi:pimeloyl-ACP methyl ester carboxylesterase